MSTIVEQNSFIKQTAFLVLRYVALKKSMIYGGLTVMIGFLLVTILLIKFSAAENKIFESLIFSTATVLITYGGYAFSSTMFNELNSAGSAPQFLSLPASTLEKLTAAWLVSFVAYTAMGAVTIYVLSLILNSHVSSELITTSLTSLHAYILIQSIFLFGAVYFKANNFLATVVAMMVVALGMSLIYIILKTLIPGTASVFDSAIIYLSELKQLGSILLTFIVYFIFSGLTYLRLKNRQIA